MIKEIKFVAFDFDGVFTDDHVWVDQDGHETVMCSRSDGYGIEMAMKAGLDMCVISRERNPIVAKRCEKLKIPCVHGVDDKLSILKREIDIRGLDPKEVAFMGNDIPDIECFQCVGLAACPNDANPRVKAICHVVTTKTGGNGAVREFLLTVMGVDL